MGWKAVKEHYRIGHIVHVNADGCICIGSPYISDLIVISPEGRLEKRYDNRGNADLARYQDEMLADPDTLAQLVAQQDRFDASIPVYTYSGSQIIERQCEVLDWPNVTHDGALMYENTFSADRAVVVAWAKRNCDLAIEFARERVQRLEKELREAEVEVAHWSEEQARLLAAEPECGHCTG